MKKNLLSLVFIFSFLLANSQCAVQLTSQTNNPCFNDCKGSATVNGTGGTSPYTYSWSNGATVPSITGLCKGIFTITVTDAVSCTATTTVNITQPSLINVNFSQVNPSCFGQCDGTATAIISGGITPYTYYWLPNGDTTQTITGLCDVSKQGPYILNVADANGCTPASVPVIINQPPGMTVSITSKNVCSGGTNGNAYANAAGGTGLYTFSWNPGGQTNDNATNLTAGTYIVTVTDSKGCSVSKAVSITQPPPLTSTTSQSNNLCNGNKTGTATINVSGGTPNYTYLWSCVPPQIAATATGLGAGTYTITITDDNGCTLTKTFNITEPAALAANPFIVAATCQACDGKITVAASSGTSPYTYSWSGGQTTAAISNLCANIYSLTVTDAAGCSKTFGIAVNNSSGSTTATTNFTNILCGGQCTGTASVSPSGGSIPYTYSWTPGNQTTASVTGICAGTQNIKVTDAAGCINFFTVTITEPPTLSPVISKNDISCNGSNNGSINIVTSGGTGAYTYSWSPGGSTVANISGLTGGTYTLTLKDGNNCSVVKTVSIIEPAVLICSATPVMPSCNGGNNGNASTLVTGGTGTYTYFWSPTGGIGSTGTGLSAGVYKLTVTDNKGCFITKNITVNEPAAITASFTTINIPCFGGASGSVTVSAASGVGAYTYSWIPGGQTTTNISNLSAGNYSVQITDGNGCTSLSQVSVTSPAKIAVVLTKQDAGCGTCTDGNATANVSGGKGPYTYSWSPGGMTTGTVTGLSVGLYSVCITDANSCSACDTIRIKNILDDINTLDLSHNILIYPNPAHNSFTFSLDIDKTSDISLTLLNILGEKVLDISEKKCNRFLKRFSTGQFPAGIYFVSILIDNELYIKKLTIY